MLLSRFKPRKIGIVVVTTVVVIIVVYTLIMLISGIKPVQKGEKIDADFEQAIIAKAVKLYLVKKDLGIDFSAGPCLSDQIEADWVLDIAHQPRTAIDDLPDNQCSAFLAGEAEHFIELDPDGNFIRLK